MTRPPGLDPEVLADLRRREASTADANRSRRAHNPFAAAATVKHVERWPCKGCNRMVGVTQETVTALAIMNADLVTRRERPIAKAAVVFCDDCKRRDADLAQLQRDGERDRRRKHEQQELPVAGAAARELEARTRRRA